jgi:hypothetical protein
METSIVAIMKVRSTDDTIDPKKKRRISNRFGPDGLGPVIADTSKGTDIPIEWILVWSHTVHRFVSALIDGAGIPSAGCPIPNTFLEVRGILKSLVLEEETWICGSLAQP